MNTSFRSEKIKVLKDDKSSWFESQIFEPNILSNTALSREPWQIVRQNRLYTISFQNIDAAE